MRKFYIWVVNHQNLILATFAVAFIIAMICKNFIAVDYDMNDYLPPDTKSTVALDTMEEEYEGGITNCRVMVQDVTIPEAMEYKAKIDALEGVEETLWLDDVESIDKPQKFMDQDNLDTYYKDRNALISVTIEEESYIKATSQIRKIIGNDNCMTGDAVSTALATNQTVKEVPFIALSGIIFSLIILLLTTTSWAEPVIVLLGIGIAIIINAGSNLIFGEISFVTNAAGSILQLAVSMDYSVFLLHRFNECRKNEADIKTAMVNALHDSTFSIFSGGFTTVIGFLALCMMRFQIGPDLGLALAKGIAISMVTVFLFMPVVILKTYRFIDKTSHRPFVPSFRGLGKFVCRFMIPFVCLFAILIVPCYLASCHNSFYFGASHILGSETQYGKDTEKITEIFGDRDAYVLMLRSRLRMPLWLM